MPVTRSSSAAAALILGPASHRQPIHGIEAKVNNSESHALALSYTLIADINQFIIPPVATSRRIDGLWQHTCFEAFIGMKDGPAYYEFNFSPSSEWAAYQFRAYRDGWPLDDDAFAPKISVEQVADRLDACDNDSIRSLVPDSPRHDASDRIDRGDRRQRGHAIVLGVAASGGRTRLSSCRFFRPRTRTSYSERLK